ncbi:flagellar biosynthesis regulator FlaF [Roseospira visakhapatnamensis]|nr:flagellar biosynthesis regulator FlaF [Roseospira visakhapatnamensis]
MAFGKAAQMMDDAQKNSADRVLFKQALRFNHLLWTIMQADITDPANKLPNEIKANIMSLSIFVDQQTTKAMRDHDPEDLTILISINRNLAMGLRETPPG